MSSKKNKWRGRKGGIQFRRETKRFSDGTPWDPATDVLYIRVAGRDCYYVEPITGLNADYYKGKMWVSSVKHTTRAEKPVAAAKIIYQSLKG